MPTAAGLVVTARILNGLRPFLSAKGVDFDVLMRQAGLDPAAVSDLDAFVSFEAFIALLERAAVLTGDDALGLHFAETYPLGPKGLFHFIMANAPTVRDALVARARYGRLVTNAYTTSLGRYDGVEAYVWHFPPTLGARAQFTDYAVMLLVERIRLLLGDRAWMPLRVDFDHKEPRSIVEFKRALGLRLRFDCCTTLLVVDPASLGQAVHSAEPLLLRDLEALASRTVAEHQEDTETIPAKVEREIVLAMPFGGLTLHAIAAKLGVSPRTVQEKLFASGQSFRGLVEATRMRMAYRLLLDTKIPLSEVALMLGFSELSAFSRAARRWFGKSATDVRKEESTVTVSERKETTRARSTPPADDVR